MSQILTPEQIEAAHLLVDGNTVTDIATHLKIDRKTLYRWRQLPEFQAEIKNIVAQMRGGLRDRLIRLADLSLEAIEREMMDERNTSERAFKANSILRMLGMANFTLPPVSDSCDQISAPQPPAPPA